MTRARLVMLAAAAALLMLTLTPVPASAYSDYGAEADAWADAADADERACGHLTGAAADNCYSARARDREQGRRTGTVATFAAVGGLFWMLHADEKRKQRKAAASR